MANPYRGEIALERDGHLDGAQHTLRLSLAALASLEKQLGVSDLSALIKLLVGGQTGAGQMHLVLREALQAGEGLSAKEAEAVLGEVAPLALARCYVDLMRATFASADER